MADSAAKEMDIRLADHFPLVHKTCKRPASKFFDCFSEKANQPPEGVSYSVICTLLLAPKFRRIRPMISHSPAATIALGAGCQ